MIKACSVFLTQRTDAGVQVLVLNGKTANFGEASDAEDRDLSIFATAARSMMMKTGCLISPRTWEDPDGALEAYCREGFEHFVGHLHYL